MTDKSNNLYSAVDPPRSAQDQIIAVDVAVDCTVNPGFTLEVQLPGDSHVLVDDGRNSVIFGVVDSCDQVVLNFEHQCELRSIMYGRDLPLA